MKRNFNSYEKISIATDIVILTTDNKEQTNKRKVAEKGLQVLLIKRDEEPYNGSWSLVGGFVNPHDTLIDCVDRKLREKTGISEIYKEQLYTYGDSLDRDPRGRVVSVAYLALAPKSKIQLDKENASKETKWFWLNKDSNNKIHLESADKEELRIEELAFDHMSILSDALERLKNKIMYTDVGFSLLDKHFTLNELEAVYSLILEKKIYGFRRIIENKVIETGLESEGKAHRPAKLYMKRD